MTLRERIETRVGRTLLGMPPHFIRGTLRLLRAPNHDGLDPTLALSLRLSTLTGKLNWSVMEVDAVRKESNALMKIADIDPPPHVAKIEDRTIPGPGGSIPIRIYRGTTSSRAPALVYFHGGGFVIGDLESHDPPCRALAREVPCTVIAIHYRLAPEHPFPAPVEDACAAFRYVVEHADELGVDASRVAVAGDSAGGNLSAVVAQQTPRPKGQVMIYPVVDMRGKTPSRKQFASGYFLTAEIIKWFMDKYRADHLDLRASPALAEERALTGLPPALIITAGFDPLHDEAAEYANALRRAGVEVTHDDYPTMMHGFFSMSGVISEGRRAISETAQWLHALFERQMS